MLVPRKILPTTHIFSPNYLSPPLLISLDPAEWERKRATARRAKKLPEKTTKYRHTYKINSGRGRPVHVFVMRRGVGRAVLDGPWSALNSNGFARPAGFCRTASVRCVLRRRRRCRGGSPLAPLVKFRRKCKKTGRYIYIYIYSNVLDDGFLA